MSVVLHQLHSPKHSTVQNSMSEVRSSETRDCNETCLTEYEEKIGQARRKQYNTIPIL